MKATFSAKANYDTSAEVKSKAAPEFSGLFSDTFLDDHIGVLVNGSYSKRHSREELANIDGWLQDQFTAGRSARNELQHQPGRAQLGAAQ